MSHPLATFPPMGRPRVSDERRIATAVRLPESIHQRLHLTARQRDVSANLLITRAVTEFLNRLPCTDDAIDTAPTSPRNGATR